ncbi:MAG: hypothetical protein ACHQNE_02410 [Candidatus Kapaibacterium sp.]
MKFTLVFWHIGMWREVEREFACRLDAEAWTKIAMKRGSYVKHDIGVEYQSQSVSATFVPIPVGPIRPSPTISPVKSARKERKPLSIETKRKPLSIETKRKPLSIETKRKPLSIETKKKQSDSWRKRWSGLTDEQKDKCHRPRGKDKPFLTFKRKVWAITNSQVLSSLPNYDKRRFHGWHVEHKFSIWQGFKHGIAPEIIGCIVNLEMIPHSENMRKGTCCSITEAELVSAYGEFEVSKRIPKLIETDGDPI